mmetsp:Transcript_24289/g.43868  ORF Transcript_24289/g.43868 Transcript_24289/m.43868 type:complete len:124 (-) Transcript_24289:2169-2540(-)
MGLMLHTEPGWRVAEDGSSGCGQILASFWGAWGQGREAISVLQLIVDHEGGQEGNMKKKSVVGKISNVGACSRGRPSLISLMQRFHDHQTNSTEDYKKPHHTSALSLCLQPKWCAICSSHGTQ